MQGGTSLTLITGSSSARIAIKAADGESQATGACQRKIWPRILIRLAGRKNILSLPTTIARIFSVFIMSIDLFPAGKFAAVSGILDSIKEVCEPGTAIPLCKSWRFNDFGGQS
jgi:hypothetical protein